MHSRYFLGSLTRIANLRDRAFRVKPISRARWARGDYVACEVVGPPTPLTRIELDTGRMIEVVEGDLVIGAFGERRATLEAVGDWRAIGDDHRMHALTAAGLFGKATSRSALLPPLLRLHYEGHILIDGEKVGMADFVEPTEERSFTTPVVLIVGTSMSAGKTTAARTIIRLLKGLDQTVVGAKLTGAGRYRDILTMKDAGADHIYDFVDVGLPSTVCPGSEFRQALGRLLSRIQAIGADIVVAEAGASPLEPYNGSIAVEELREVVRMIVVCASDPYAAFGVMHSFGIRPDVVTGPATSTQAAIELVERLAGVKALNILRKESRPPLLALLSDRLGVGSASGR